MLNRMSKENLQSPNERSSRIHVVEVRSTHSSYEVGQCPWSKGVDKIWNDQHIIAPLSEERQARQR